MPFTAPVHAAPSLRLRHRHLIIALHGHQLMQPVAFLAVIVVAFVFQGNKRLNLCNDLLALRKLLGSAQLIKLTLGSVVDDKICFMCGIEFLLVLFLADHAILLDNGIGVAVIGPLLPALPFCPSPWQRQRHSGCVLPVLPHRCINSGEQLVWR